jgi:hypothetical protein
MDSMIRYYIKGYPDIAYSPMPVFYDGTSRCGGRSLGPCQSCSCTATSTLRTSSTTTAG